MEAIYGHKFPVGMTFYILRLLFEFLALETTLSTQQAPFSIFILVKTDGYKN